MRVKAVELGIRLRPPSVDCRRVNLPETTWLGLKAVADRYGITVARLARLLIEIVVRDRLFDAVIDDTRPARRRTNGHPGSGLHQLRV